MNKLNEGRIKPHHFETFYKPVSALLNYKIDPSRSELKIYYRKRSDSYFVSLYDTDGAIYSTTLNKSKYRRLCIFASKVYYLHQENQQKYTIKESQQYDFYLEWVCDDYFTSLVKDTTLFFICVYFSQIDFLDLDILSKRAEINISNYIKQVTDKYKQKIKKRWKKVNSGDKESKVISKEESNDKDKTGDDLDPDKYMSQYKKVIEKIIKLESDTVPFFWDDFKQIMTTVSFDKARLHWSKTIQSNRIFERIIKYAVDVKTNQLSELKERKDAYANLSPTFAYGPGSVVYKQMKQDFKLLVKTEKESNVLVNTKK